jgi:hypothetical protein
MCCRFIPAYKLQTHEAVFLTDGVAGVGDNRLPEASHEMAELGQNNHTEQGQDILPSQSSGYVPFNNRTSNSVHPSLGKSGPLHPVTAHHANLRN